MSKRDPVVFVPEGTGELGRAITARLGTKPARHVERDFTDGEHKARSLTNVRNRDVYVVHSLHSDDRSSVNDRLCRLLFFLGSLRDADARRVTAVTPYLCYARKDRRTKSRDPVTTRYVGGLFESVGTDCLVTMDVHNLAAFENAFRIRTVHLEARPLFVRRLFERFEDESLAVVSPDAGGMKRARKLQRTLEREGGRPVETAFMDKQRSMGTVSGDLFAGAVEDRTALIVDDLISSGGTMVRTARRCRRQGARAVYALATHGLFAGDAPDTLADESLDGIWISDTVPPQGLEDEAVREKIEVISTAEAFADAVHLLHEGGDLEANYALSDDVAYFPEPGDQGEA